MNTFRRFLSKCVKAFNLCFPSNFGTFVVVQILFLMLVHRIYLIFHHQSEVEPSGVCLMYGSIKCENGGLLEQTENTLECKCTEYYDGENCTIAKPFVYAVVSWLRRGIGSLYTDTHKSHPGMWWYFLPFTSDMQLKNIYTFHQNKMKKLSEKFSVVTKHRYGFGRNIMTSTRILPPARPLHCELEKRFPSLSVLYDQIFQRGVNQKYLPDQRRRNLLYSTFYQYFVLQFFNVDFNASVSASQLYGADEITQRQLRLLSGGKLKTEYLNEHYPPLLTSVKNVKMVYPHVKQSLNTEWFNRILMHSNTFKKQNQKWAMGHPLLSMHPMLFVMSTLWIREHNRVCDVLAQEWPSWTDDQIYDTARRIVIGELMVIMMDDIINVHTERTFPLEFKPEIYHNRLQNISNVKTPFEFLLVSMLSSSLPEKLRDTSIQSMLFSNNSQVYDTGMSDTVRCMVDQEMGTVTLNNDGAATEPLTRLMMKLSRENAVQSFNNYRRQLGLRAYGGFFELTGNQESVDKLRAVYENIEDVELLPGILSEKKYYGNSPTATVLSNSFIVNSILTNPLTSKQLWTADTFSGSIAFDMVKSATIKSLVCNNLVDKCDGFNVQKLYTK